MAALQETLKKFFLCSIMGFNLTDYDFLFLVLADKKLKLKLSLWVMGPGTLVAISLQMHLITIHHNAIQAIHIFQTKTFLVQQVRYFL